MSVFFFVCLNLLGYIHEADVVGHWICQRDARSKVGKKDENTRGTCVAKGTRKERKKTLTWGDRRGVSV